MSGLLNLLQNPLITISIDVIIAAIITIASIEISRLIPIIIISRHCPQSTSRFRLPG